MAEKNKKRGGRRAHLNDFHVNLAGDYVYTGTHYSYVDQGRSRDRVQRELLGLSVAVVLAVAPSLSITRRPKSSVTCCPAFSACVAARALSS